MGLECDKTEIKKCDYVIDYCRVHSEALKDAGKYDGVDVMWCDCLGLIDILNSYGDMEKRYGIVYFLIMTSRMLKI